MSDIPDDVMPPFDPNNLVDLLVQEVDELEKELEATTKDLNFVKAVKEESIAKISGLTTQVMELTVKNAELKEEISQFHTEQHKKRCHLGKILSQEGNELEREMKGAKRALDTAVREIRELKATVAQTKKTAEEDRIHWQQEFEIQKFQLTTAKEKLEKEVAGLKAEMEQRNHKWSLKCNWLSMELEKSKNESYLDLHMEETARKLEKLKFDEECDQLKGQLINAQQQLDQEKQERRAEYDRIISSVQSIVMAMLTLEGYQSIEIRCDEPNTPPIEMMMVGMLDVFRRRQSKMEREQEKVAWYKKAYEGLLKWKEEGEAPDNPPITGTNLVPMPSCQICLREFSSNPDLTPRTLGCGHTICEECATKISATSWSPFFIKCPIDRQDFPLPNCSVQDIPKNWTVVQMIGDRLQSQSS